MLFHMQLSPKFANDLKDCKLGFFLCLEKYKNTVQRVQIFQRRSPAPTTKLPDQNPHKLTAHHVHMGTC
jgi:hypothetical protein